MLKRSVLLLGCLFGLSWCAIGCGDDDRGGAAADMRAPLGCYLSNIPPCCPNQDPVTGQPSGACAVEGSTCDPGSTEISCSCVGGSWKCVGAFVMLDLSARDLSSHD